MDAFTPNPMTVIGPSEEAMPLPEFPDLDRNWAGKPEVDDYIAVHIVNTAMEARNHRKALEEEWREVRRMVSLTHDAGRKYVGRSEAYVPLYKQARQALVSRLTRGLFPSDEYMDVQARNSSGPDDESAKATKDYLQYEFEKCAKLRVNMKPFLTQFLDYGWAVAKVWYHKQLAQTMRMTRANAMMGPQPARARDYAIEGLRFRARNVFFFYVWPTTVDDIEEATLVFEDMAVHKSFIEEMGRKNKWIRIQDALYAPFDPAYGYNMMELQQETANNSVNPTTGGPQGDPSHWRALTEAWFSMPLPREAYVAGEEVGTPVRVVAHIAGNVVLSVRRHPFWHGKLPYIVKRHNPEPGAFYNKGHGYTAKYMQYLINDFANQMNDNMTYGLNPMAFVNPALLAGPLSPLRPGGVWLTTDVRNGIMFDRPPVEQVQYGITVLQLWISLLNDSIGTPPILQGTSAAKGARTATSSQILQTNAQNPIQDTVEDCEAEVMVPLMHMAYSLGQQYRTEELWVTVTGGPPVRITPQMLVGDFFMRWLASSQQANQAQRALQAQTFLQMVAALQPLLQMQGKSINPIPIIKRLWSDGFGFRGFDQIVVDAPMMAGPPGTEGQAPAGVGAGAGAGSAEEPAEPDVGIGEGTEAERDIMNSMLGSMGGM